MTDRIRPSLRSGIMSRIRGKNTEPEMRVRRLVHRMGFRYRLHCGDLPGAPDLVFFSRRKIIFVHGCFWHQHDCSRGTRPSSNEEFWNRKLDSNVRRDKKNISTLKSDGWAVLIIWECETKNLDHLAVRIEKFLNVGK